MKTITRYARTTLEARALRMLRTLGTSAAIRSAMAAHGYTQAEHEEGWNLCVALGGYRGTPVESNEAAIRAALAAVTDFAHRDLARLASGVKRFFPEQYEALFGGLVMTTEANPVVEANLFLDRYEAMNGKGAKKTDHAVVALLAQRGFDKDAAAKLGAELEATRVEPEANITSTDAERDARRDALLQKLQVWFDDWSLTARMTFHRKDHLIRLGIGHRVRKPAVTGGVVATPDPTPALPPAKPVLALVADTLQVA